MESPRIAIWKYLQVAMVLYILVVGGITGYANNHYVHGPMIPNGLDVCEHDDGGPCHEDATEDTRNLNIPNWVKFERNNESAFLLSFLAAGLVAIYAASKSRSLL